MFISHIKEIKNKQGDIGETVSDIDFITITMNGMIYNYEMFITGLNVREKALKFEEFTVIPMQEEERQMTPKPQSLDFSLMAKRKPFRGKTSVAHKSGGTHKEIHLHLKVCLRTEVIQDQNVFIALDSVI